MPFIGVIAKESDNNYIKKELVRNIKNTKFEVLNVNKKSIENLKNIRFDVIVINDDIEDFLNISNYLVDIIKKTKYLIINSDVIDNIESKLACYIKRNNSNELQREMSEQILNSQIITYGLNKKAIVTMSSIKSDNILICVQNKFKNYYGEVVEEQEVNVEVSKNNLKKICNSMAIFTILTIFGENLKKI